MNNQTRTIFEQNTYVLIEGPQCPACTKLKNMLNAINTKYATIQNTECPELKISTIPTLYKRGSKIIEGCPGQITELRRAL